MPIPMKDIIAHTEIHVVYIENGYVYTAWNTRDGFTRHERCTPRAEKIWLDIHSGLYGI